MVTFDPNMHLAIYHLKGQLKKKQDGIIYNCQKQSVHVMAN